MQVEIGGQRIDQHYGVWLEIWDELTQTSEKQNGYNHMIKGVDLLSPHSQEKYNTVTNNRHFVQKNVWTPIICCI